MPPSTSARIVEKVADREGIAPTELDTPLYHAVDPGALDALFDDGRGRDGGYRRVEFEYNGYLVTVSSADRIRLQETGDVARDTNRVADPDQDLRDRSTIE